MFTRSIRHTGPSEAELHFCKCYDTILFGILWSVVLFYGSEDLHFLRGLWSCSVYTSRVISVVGIVLKKLLATLLYKCHDCARKKKRTLQMPMREMGVAFADSHRCSKFNRRDEPKIQERMEVASLRV